MPTESLSPSTVLDVAFEGGGARGLVLNGAIAALQDQGYTFRRLVGTSSGAITATLTAAGYQGEALRALGLEQTARGTSRMTDFVRTPSDFSDAALLQSSLGTFFSELDLPLVPSALESRLDLHVMQGLMKRRLFPNMLSLIERGGFFSAQGFVDWLREKLDADGRSMGSLTLAGFHDRTGVDLSIVASNTSRESMLVLNHRTAPDCPIVSAVRMSMSIPFLWPEVIWQADWGRYCDQDLTGDAVVDGGVVSNFPLRLLISPEPWVTSLMGVAPDPVGLVLGLDLNPQQPVPGAPPTVSLGRDLAAAEVYRKLFGRVERLLNTILASNDAALRDHHAMLICSLPVQGYGVAEFNMSPDRVTALMDAGAAAVQRWLCANTGPCSIAEARTRFLLSSEPPTPLT